MLYFLHLLLITSHISYLLIFLTCIYC